MTPYAVIAFFSFDMLTPMVLATVLAFFRGTQTQTSSHQFWP